MKITAITLCIVFLLSGTVFAGWIANFKLYYGTSSGNYSNSVTVGRVHSYTLTGLSNGTKYFAATAIDNNGVESDYSNEVTKVVSDTTAYLAWDWPTTNTDLTLLVDPQPAVKSKGVLMRGVTSQ